MVTRSDYKEHDNDYPRMKVYFLKWRDGDMIDWISKVEIFFFCFHKTLEDSKMKIASIQLDYNTIQ